MKSSRLSFGSEASTNILSTTEAEGSMLSYGELCFLDS